MRIPRPVCSTWSIQPPLRSNLQLEPGGRAGRRARTPAHRPVPGASGAVAALAGGGWDNAVWLVNERYAFRSHDAGSRSRASSSSSNYFRSWHRSCRCPCPNRSFAGGLRDGYPWPFFGSELLPGREPATPSSTTSAPRIALQLAAFCAPPRPPPRRAAAAGRELPRRHDRRVPLARKQLAELERLGLWRAPRARRAPPRRAERLPPSALPAVVHGDLHFRHVLVEGRRVSGVIDWGDLCRSDPAVDLPLCWGFLPPAARERSSTPTARSRRPAAARAGARLLGVRPARAQRRTSERGARGPNGGLERALVDY